MLRPQRCGADCVKLQKSSLPDKFARSALGRPYEGPHSWGATYGEHKAHLELSDDDYLQLQQHAKQAGHRAGSSETDGQTGRRQLTVCPMSH